LGQLLGVPVGETILVDVPDTLLPNGDGRVPSRMPGIQFGVKEFPNAQTDDAKLRVATNFEQFCGVVVFDTYIARADSRQHLVYASDGNPNSDRDRAAIFDQGFAFTGQPNWTTTSLQNPLPCVINDALNIKQHFSVITSYELFLNALESLKGPDLELILREPPIAEWGVVDDEIVALLNWLEKRKSEVRAVIQDYLR